MRNSADHINAALLSALLAMSAICSLGAGIQTPDVNAVIPQIVPQEQLMRYNGVNASIQVVVYLTAPTVAGAVFVVRLTYTQFSYVLQ